MSAVERARAEEMETFRASMTRPDGVDPDAP
jgi:hypothetical protein